MSMTTDDLTQELGLLDPVDPAELEGALDTPEAAAMLERILALELDPADQPLHGDDRLPRVGRRRRGAAKTAAAALVVVVVVGALALLVGLPGGGGGDAGREQLASALDGAAAATQPQAGGGLPFTYLKTREMSVSTADGDGRSWSVAESVTREEWVAWDGSGRLRIVTGPSRFIEPSDRAEWKAAGSPSFLALGFGRRTEDRWLAAGLSRRSVEELPTEPAALATRLRYEAEVGHGEIPVPAATLQLIGEDLRDPGASAQLRQALYRAVRRVPGIEYLGETTDPAGRSGIAVGVTSSYAGGPARYSLIFDPDTSRVLATETTSLAAAGSGRPPAPTVLHATVYLRSRGIKAMPKFGGTWLSGFEPPAAAARSDAAAYLVYRIPTRDPWLPALDSNPDEYGGMG